MSFQYSKVNGDTISVCFSTNGDYYSNGQELYRYGFCDKLVLRQGYREYLHGFLKGILFSSRDLPFRHITFHYRKEHNTGELGLFFKCLDLCPSLETLYILSHPPEDGMPLLEGLRNHRIPGMKLQMEGFKFNQSEESVKCIYEFAAHSSAVNLFFWTCSFEDMAIIALVTGIRKANTVKDLHIQLDLRPEKSETLCKVMQTLQEIRCLKFIELHMLHYTCLNDEQTRAFTNFIHVNYWTRPHIKSDSSIRLGPKPSMYLRDYWNSARHSRRVHSILALMHCKGAKGEKAEIARLPLEIFKMLASFIPHAIMF